MWVETGLGLRSSPPRCEWIASRTRSRFRYPHAIRSFRWIRGSIDSDAAFEFLKRVSQHENTKLHAVAEAIVVQRDANARPGA